MKPGSTYLFATRYNEKENWYTLNPYPTARIKINPTENRITDAQLRTLTDNNVRVEELKEAYTKEIPLNADVVNNKALNNYKSLQKEI